MRYQRFLCLPFELPLNIARLIWWLSGTSRYKGTKATISCALAQRSRSQEKSDTCTMQLQNQRRDVSTNEISTRRLQIACYLPSKNRQRSRNLHSYASSNRSKARPKRLQTAWYQGLSVLKPHNASSNCTMRPQTALSQSKRLQTACLSTQLLAIREAFSPDKQVQKERQRSHKKIKRSIYTNNHSK